MEGDCALPDLCFVIAREALVLLVREVPPPFAVVLGAALAERALLGYAPSDVNPEVRIVDRQHPADRLAAVIRVHARVGHGAYGRKDHLGDAMMHASVRQL